MNYIKRLKKAFKRERYELLEYELVRELLGVLRHGRSENACSSAEGFLYHIMQFYQDEMLQVYITQDSIASAYLNIMGEEINWNNYQESLDRVQALRERQNLYIQNNPDFHLN